MSRSAVGGFFLDELAEAAAALGIVEKNKVVAVEDPEELIPGHAMQAAVVVAARLVIIDPQQSAVATPALGCRNDCRMASPLHDPFADLVMAGRGLCGRHFPL